MLGVHFSQEGSLRLLRGLEGHTRHSVGTDHQRVVGVRLGLQVETVDNVRLILHQIARTYLEMVGVGILLVVETVGTLLPHHHLDVHVASLVGLDVVLSRLLDPELQHDPLAGR